MITETGGNLSVLILGETSQDWEAFCTWYSINKNLPDAKIAIGCIRNKDAPMRMFQWSKRLEIPNFRWNPSFEDKIPNLHHGLFLAHRKGFIGTNVLLLTPLTTVMETLPKEFLDSVTKEKSILDKSAWFINNYSESDSEDAINEYYVENRKYEPVYKLCHEAKFTKEPKPIICYEKGCGKWIHKLKGCPFANAGRLATETMTINEHRIIELWKKMVTVYNVIV